MELVLPRTELEQSYRAYILELGGEERYPFPLDYEHADFRALIKRLLDLSGGVEVPEGYVPSTTFWLVDGQELVGVSNLRHYLNDRIERHGGHIELGIRPSRRGQGSGTKLLALTIREAQKRGIGEVHIHCLKSNVPSARMIVRNGGILHSEVRHEATDDLVQRYRVGAA